ncbi:MAG TPA: hypothetical protein VKG66_05915 [Steroidobacteraceae bacterium]|nr:hypothetical protein [Steroidobacteraceae bacterium]
MPRRGERDCGKERFWRQVLRHWQRSGQTVRSYCGERGLSEPSFYGWRRTIQERNRQVARACRRGAPQAGQVGATGSACCHAEAQPAFVPLTMLAPAPALEVVLRDGCVIHVPAGFEAGTLRQLLAVLAEVPPC